MKTRWLVMLLLALLAAFFDYSDGYANAASCTPSTCPPGPVRVGFEYLNCTGSYAFYPFASEAGCNGAGLLVTIDDEEVIIYDMHNPQCDLTDPYVTYTATGYRFGKCALDTYSKRGARSDFDAEFENFDFGSSLADLIDFPLGSSNKIARNEMDILFTGLRGMMILPNVNTSIPSHHAHFEYNPSITDGAVITESVQHCDRPDECTLPSGERPPYWFSMYSDMDCRGLNYSIMYTNWEFNTCYNANNLSYLSTACNEGHVLQVNSYFGGSCDVPAMFTLHKQSCSSTSLQALHCSAMPLGCLSHPPTPAFQCIKGVWTAPTIEVPSITIPASTTPTIFVINGNLTTTGGGIIFMGLGSQLVLNGCLFLNDNEVTIELTLEELEQLEKEGKLSKTLITALIECQGSSDLGATTLNIRKPKNAKNCQKVKVQNSGSSSSTLVVAFETDFKSCNTKWIILGSVLGSIIFLAIIFALLATLTPFKYIIRPYAKRAAESNTYYMNDSK